MVVIAPVLSQTDDTFNPDNPDEPGSPSIPVVVPKYAVKVLAIPQEGGSVSTSLAEAETGKEVRLTATPSSDFTFKGWYVSDTLFTKDATFNYVMEKSDIVFVALFEFIPVNPDEPSAPDNPESVKTYHVSLTAIPTDGGSLSINQPKLEEGETTHISAQASTGFVFNGWYVADTLFSEATAFDYTMGNNDILFVARFIFSL